MATDLQHQIVKSELERIYEERSRLTPDDVVDEASDPASPLHSYFEWDDSEAAARFRLIQAAGLIRSVKVRVTRTKGSEDEDLTIRAWVAAHAAAPELEDVPEGYIPEEEVRARPELREALLRQMRRDVTAAQRRYRHLAEYWELLDELNKQRGRKRAG